MKTIVIHSKKYGRHEVFVDDEDYELVRKYTWTLQFGKKGKGVFRVNAWINGRTEKIHRFLLKIPYKTDARVIHLDGNNFNNQKSNLKKISLTQEFFIRDTHVDLVLNSHAFGTKVCIFDLKFYDQFVNLKWRIIKGHKTFYCATMGPKNEVLCMHFLINGKGAHQTDHIDGNGLNNFSNNLRNSDASQNKFNSPKHITNSSGFKGVHKSSWKGKRFSVVLNSYRKRYYGGYFDDPIEAAKKYNELALEHHGKFAKLNPIPNE